MKKILGLDVGTNSVGWAIINHDFNSKTGEILGMGSRIIPMDQGEISKFNDGNLQSSAAQRTQHRGVRRLIERSKNRRKRLIKSLKIIGFIPSDFKVNHLHSLAYKKIDGKTSFCFMDSYQEMKAEFHSDHPENIPLPYDWTIYYLRKKALKHKISKLELAWVILQFNTKRGYFQLRGDNSLDTDSKKYFVKDIVDNIVEIDNSRGNKIFEIELRNEIVGLYSSKEEPNWIGKEVEFIVTENRLKSGELKVKLSTPDENDWTLRKKKTESDIESKGLSVGEYIYNALLSNPQAKIRGELVHTIDRTFFKEELEKILANQSNYHSELNDNTLLQKCAKELYKNNKAHRDNLIERSITHLIVNDIIYYQRPLKSKKHLISDCKYESYQFKRDGKLEQKKIKVTPKSNPFFQEYRIWSFIHNLKIFKREHRTEDGILKLDHEVSDEYLNFQNKAKLFDLFKYSKELSHSQILKAFGLDLKNYKINYEEGKKIKGHETNSALLNVIIEKSLEKELKSVLSDRKKAMIIWHSIYSIQDKKEFLLNALGQESLALSKDLAKALSEVPPFKKDYSSLSQKAISKLLPVMRCGKYWNEEYIDNKTKSRIEKLITAEFDETISDRLRTKLANATTIQDFQGLQEWAASYVVYNRHSESAENIQAYNSYEEIDVNRLIPQHSLRNPVVEKILRETMLVVRDIWKEYGKPDRIHVELARELKMSNDQRKNYTRKRNENEARNKRAIAMLRELQKDDQSINPYSIGQLELFKLYEEGATFNEGNLNDDIKAIRRKDDPSTSELIRYKLWLDQKYLSPYTGQPIPLSKLFTPAYEIEHILPKSRYYDNSFNNKIICEREANKLKSDQTAYEFICAMGGNPISGNVKILKKDEYETLVKSMYWTNRTKIRNLLSHDLPKEFNTAQLNNTRYINKKLITLLNPVVKADKEGDWISTNLLPLSGGITFQLRKSWGLSDVWKKILAPRFQRMNEITNSKDFYNLVDGRIDLSGNETDIKRLDHRHHALDALVVACTSRQHIQYINSYRDKNKRYELMPKLFTRDRSDRYTDNFILPWKSFCGDCLNQLEKIIPSFKKNTRVINRTRNYYQKYFERNGKMVKAYVRQNKSEDYWAIRQSLHKDTIFGQRQIREYKSVNLSSALNDISSIADKELRNKIKKMFIAANSDLKTLKKMLKENPIIKNGKELKKVKIYYNNSDYSSSRTTVDTTLTKKNIETKVLGTVVKKALLDHLEKYNDDPVKAFDTNGLIELNKNRNNPIKKVTLVEALGKKFKLGEKGVNKEKFVEADKGTNLFFIVYKNKKTGELSVDKESSLSFIEVVNQFKLGYDAGEDRGGYDRIILSPGDLVFVLDDNSLNSKPDFSNKADIYKCVSFSKSDCFFVPANYANAIKNKRELGPLNKMEKSLEGITIKRNFYKIKVNRLGQILND